MSKLKSLAALGVLSVLVVAGVVLNRSGQPAADSNHTAHVAARHQPSATEQKIVLQGLGMS